ncbi:mechanosensitive ion channel family protein [Salinisphaera sp. Q1T1-3]|uniref:mechanosensitive ion channel family protein n=1 Tax=Salinisphaera sp. Q1T1-3 TaxID=2321229 RepID=UPI0011C344E1|nr:mechanosensitive ion channel family protein [Salinisphaera sp. Q1T1-3]
MHEPGHIVCALADIADVEVAPAPEAFVWDLAASWVTIRVRWWTDRRRADVVRVRAQVLRAIKYALDDAGIDMPYETRVALWHDQTDSVDGDRSRQREGWPADPADPSEPRWQARQRRRAAKAASASDTDDDGFDMSC